MHIRCWGSRGSIPVSGKRYLKYGGDTTCMEIRSASGDIVVVDAGSGIRALGHQLLKEKARKITLLFTHAHLDHLMGFPFFIPLFVNGVHLTVRGPRLNKASFRDVLAEFLAQPYFPVQLSDKDIKAKLTFVDTSTHAFSVGSLRIQPVRLSHPKNGGLGYKFEEGGKSFVFLTDNELGYVHEGGLTFGEYVDFCKGADLLIHDAEYTAKDYRHIRAISETPWGHSQYADAVRLGVEARVASLGLFHLNQKRSDVQVDRMVSAARRLVKRSGVRLNCFAVGNRFELEL